MTKRITINIHHDLYEVIQDYADNHDCSLSFAVAQICGIGAEAITGKTVKTITKWGGKREGAGRPPSED